MAQLPHGSGKGGQHMYVKIRRFVALLLFVVLLMAACGTNQVQGA